METHPQEGVSEWLHHSGGGWDAHETEPLQRGSSSKQLLSTARSEKSWVGVGQPTHTRGVSCYPGKGVSSIVQAD